MNLSRFIEGIPPDKLAPHLGGPDAATIFKRLLLLGADAVPFFAEALKVKLDTPADVILHAPRTQRHLAAEGLGRLKHPSGVGPLMNVLDDEDNVLRARAIWALSEIGDARAIPALIPLLGEQEILKELQYSPRPGGTKSKPGTGARQGERHKYFGTVNLRSLADHALHRLGAGELADAFTRVLTKRDVVALAPLKQQHQHQIIAAMTRALETGGLAYVSNAAWALGELGAVEALPMLLSKIGFFSMFTEAADVREACAEAIEKLEFRATLPRSNAAAIATDSLPRSSSAGDVVETDTLPRMSGEQ